MSTLEHAPVELPAPVAIGATVFFLSVDALLVAGCAIKFLDGGWFPLALGLLLFILLWLYARKPRKTGQVAAAFLFGYGVFRFIAEFFREPLAG